MTLKGRCTSDPESGGTALELWVASSVNADVNYSYDSRHDAGPTAPIADGVAVGAGGLGRVAIIIAPGVFHRAEGQFVYHNSKRVIWVIFHAVANTGTHRCQVTGTALPAPG